MAPTTTWVVATWTCRWVQMMLPPRRIWTTTRITSSTAGRRTRPNSRGSRRALTAVAATETATKSAPARWAKWAAISGVHAGGGDLP